MIHILFKSRLLNMKLIDCKNLIDFQVELEELKGQLKDKNSYLKLAIDKVSEIIWQINSMQKLRQ